MGKRRTAMEKIACPKARNVCFSKRRQGLFKKAAQLSRLHNLDIASVVFSPAGNPFVFGDISLLFDRYIATERSGPHPSSSSSSSVVTDSSMDTYDPARLSDIQNLLNVNISNLNVSELKDYADNLESLKSGLLMALDQNQEDEGFGFNLEEILSHQNQEDDGFGFTLEEILSHQNQEDDGFGFTLEEILSHQNQEDDGFGLTLEEIFSQFEGDDNDNDLSKNEDFEDMVRELLMEDTDCNQIG